MPRYLIDAIPDIIACRAFGDEIMAFRDTEGEIVILPSSLRFALMEAFLARQYSRK